MSEASDDDWNCFAEPDPRFEPVNLQKAVARVIEEIERHRRATLEFERRRAAFPFVIAADNKS